ESFGPRHPAVERPEDERNPRSSALGGEGAGRRRTQGRDPVDDVELAPADARTELPPYQPLEIRICQRLQRRGCRPIDPGLAAQELAELVRAPRRGFGIDRSEVSPF